VVAALDVRPALGNLIGRNARCGKHLPEVGSCQVLDRAGVGDLVDTAPHERVTHKGAGGRMLGSVGGRNSMAIQS
jgi:hypothetical protein